MTQKQVTVVQIEKIKGTKADRIVLHYVGNDGTTWKIGALVAKLSTESREVLLAAKAGDSLLVDIQKEGNYWNLMSVVDTVAETATSAAKKTIYNKTNNTIYNKAPQEGRLTDVEKAEGMQRGNAVTNATNLVIAFGKPSSLPDAVSMVKNTAQILVEAIDELDNLPKNEVELSKQTEQDLDDPEVTQELGF